MFKLQTTVCIVLMNTKMPSYINHMSEYIAILMEAAPVFEREGGLFRWLPVSWPRRPTRSLDLCAESQNDVL